jgi:hypothetical protein
VTCGASAGKERWNRTGGKKIAGVTASALLRFLVTPALQSKIAGAAKKNRTGYRP